MIIHRKYKFNFLHYKNHFQIIIIMKFGYHLGLLRFTFRFWKLFLGYLLLHLINYFHLIPLHFITQLKVEIIQREKNLKKRKVLSLMVVWVMNIFVGRYRHHHLMKNVLKGLVLFLLVFIKILVVIFFVEIFVAILLRKMMIENCFLLTVRILLKFLFFVVFFYYLIFMHIIICLKC